MFLHLNEIYDKRPPIFLACIVTALTSGLMLFRYAHPHICSLTPQLLLFYKILLTASVSQLLTKTVLLGVVYGINRQCANTLNSTLMIGYGLLSLGIWIYGVILYNKDRNGDCSIHQYYLMTLLLTYGIVIFGGLALMLMVILHSGVAAYFALSTTKHSESIQ